MATDENAMFSIGWHFSVMSSGASSLCHPAPWLSTLKAAGAPGQEALKVRQVETGNVLVGLKCGSPEL